MVGLGFFYYSLMSFLGHGYLKKYLRNKSPSRQLLLHQKSHHLAVARKPSTFYTSFSEQFLTSHPSKTESAP